MGKERGGPPGPPVPRQRLTSVDGGPTVIDVLAEDV